MFRHNKNEPPPTGLTTKNPNWRRELDAVRTYFHTVGVWEAFPDFSNV